VSTWVADVLTRAVREPLGLGLEDEPLDGVGDGEVQGQRRGAQAGLRALAVDQVVVAEVHPSETTHSTAVIQVPWRRARPAWIQGRPSAYRPDRLVTDVTA
jgi:hypothetical protein